jgi:hypothetical protein
MRTLIVYNGSTGADTVEKFHHGVVANFRRYVQGRLPFRLMISNWLVKRCFIFK